MQGKQILATNEKYDIADHGIREAVFSGNMRDINLILENIVYFPKYVVSLDEFSSPPLPITINPFFCFPTLNSSVLKYRISS